MNKLVLSSIIFSCILAGCSSSDSENKEPNILELNVSNESLEGLWLAQGNMRTLINSITVGSQSFTPPNPDAFLHYEFLFTLKKIDASNYQLSQCSGEGKPPINLTINDDYQIFIDGSESGRAPRGNLTNFGLDLDPTRAMLDSYNVLNDDILKTDFDIGITGLIARKVRDDISSAVGTMSSGDSTTAVDCMINITISNEVLPTLAKAQYIKFSNFEGDALASSWQWYEHQPDQVISAGEIVSTLEQQQVSGSLSADFAPGPHFLRYNLTAELADDKNLAVEVDMTKSIAKE